MSPSNRTPVTGRTRDLVIFLDRMVAALGRHWLLMVNLLLGLYVGGAVLAPTLMAAGFDGPGHLLYTLYGFTCHQIPQRAYYLFGPDGFVSSYNVDKIVAAGADVNNLRAFIGTPAMGFKLADCHRDNAIYWSMLVGGILFDLFRRRRTPKPLPFSIYLLLIAPMFFDGVSQFINDVTPWGWRTYNAWAVWLTGGIFPQSFYVGTRIGTLNWLLRTVTGSLFGLATVAMAYPYLEEGFADILEQAEQQLHHAAMRDARESE
ncbi:MAG: DUF2085 domain-containing protein [Chloroflexi bacterium]|nr:DUF2085 domain-containing protein [Chloroflexota bacterium]